MRRHSVEEIMTRDVVSVRETSGYKEIVETLASHALSAVPVLDDDGRVLGIVSEADLLHKIEFAGFDPQVRLFERKRVRTARAKAGAETALELMTSPAIVISERETAAAAAKLLDTERVKRLPVVDETGRLVGIVSRGDLLRLFLREDQDILAEVRDEVLLKTLWIDPTDLGIEVDRGVVTLTGTLDRRSALPLVVRLVETVAGVVDVVDHLSYHYDDIRGREERPVLPTVA